MSCLRNDFLIRRRIRGRQPVLNVHSQLVTFSFQLVTYRIPSVSATKGGKKDNKRFISFISFDDSWTMPKMCATADNPSAFVNRSNLSRAACILPFFFPNTFFAYFTETN